MITRASDPPMKVRLADKSDIYASNRGRKLPRTYAASGRRGLAAMLDNGHITSRCEGRSAEARMTNARICLLENIVHRCRTAGPCVYCVPQRLDRHAAVTTI